MVRCLGLVLVLVLLLCGCAQQTVTTPETTGSPSNDIVSGADHSVEYVPDSAVEQATSGAVRSYALSHGGYYGCVMHDGALVLLCQQNGAGELTIYKTNPMEKMHAADLGTGADFTMSKMQISQLGLTYFNYESKEIVFLNNAFTETGRMRLGEDLQGEAWVSPDWKTAFYCTSQGICAMDLQTGISRLLREQNAFAQRIAGVFGDGKALLYDLEIEEGQKELLLVDAQSGMVLYKDDSLRGLTTNGQDYFFDQNVRGVQSLRFGTGAEHFALWPVENDAQATMLFESKAVVMTQTLEDQTNLAYYDLTTGKRTATVTLPGVTEVWSIATGATNEVWFLGADTEATQTLYRWDLTKSQTTDEAVYTAPWYTLETPDSEGLVQVQLKATEIGRKFGVEILVWNDAVSLAPADQFFTAEHMTQLYEYYLPKLEEALSIFPKEIFKQTSKNKLRIVLLHEIAGEPAWGTLAQTDRSQFWKGDVPVVALTLNDNFERNVYHSIYLYIEARLLSKSSALYEWYRMNPSKFEYDNSYIKNLERTDMTYIDGGTKRYFIDLFSMSYAKEDRATIFEYACMSENQELFKNSVLQEKLRRICKGIREAYGLKKVETEFLWEQYKA